VQAIGLQPQRAPDGAPVHYERHRPEQTTLHRLVQQHAATFFAQAEDAAGADLPQFVKDEFDAFLECGILAHGFLRLRCGDCGHDKLVAFSCKRRGFCPSCGARRMAQTAAHLVDHVIPPVPVRQWVLSLPIPLRLLLAAQPKLVTPMLQVVHRVITRHLLGQAGLKADEADSGAVTLIQLFGSAANLNIHLHCLVLDGVYRRGSDGVLEFVEVPAPTDEALQAVLHKIITRTMKLLTRRGALVEEEGSAYVADNDGDSDEARLLRPLQAAACTYSIAFGPRAGQKVLTVQGVMPRDADFMQQLCADIDGFSLHAAVRCGADDRQALEQLCRYIITLGAGQRARKDQRRGSGGAQAEDPLARRHHRPGDVVATVHEDGHQRPVCGGQIQVRCVRSGSFSNFRPESAADSCQPTADIQAWMPQVLSQLLSSADIVCFR
jgi:hypothetical protein